MRGSQDNVLCGVLMGLSAYLRIRSVAIEQWCQERQTAAFMAEVNQNSAPYLQDAIRRQRGER